MSRWIGSIFMLVGLICACHAITALDKTTSGSPEQRTAFFGLGISLLVMSGPTNFLLGEWRRSVRSSIPGDAKEVGNQAGRGLASISHFRGVLLCLSGLGVWFLAYAARHPGHDADGVWIWANMAFALLTVLVPLFGAAGFYFALVGLFQSRQWRSVAITGLIFPIAKENDDGCQFESEGFVAAAGSNQLCHQRGHLPGTIHDLRCNQRAWSVAFVSYSL